MIGRASRFGVPKVRSARKGVQGTGRQGGTNFPDGQLHLHA